VDFQVNRAIAELQLQPTIDGQRGLDRLPGFIVRRYGAPARVPLPYQYAEPKLQRVVESLAAQVDREARAALPDLVSQSVTPQQAGVTLDKATTINALLSAFASSINRTVDAPVDTIPIGAASVKTLEPEIAKRLAAFVGDGATGNTAAVFIKDLQTGEELVINGDVAVSAAGWLKMGVMFESARVNTLPFSADLTAQLGVIANADDGATTNAVLATLGNGDAQRGVDAVNDTLKQIGLRNTFLAQPYRQSAKAPNVITPANSRGDISLTPDTNAQSTVADVGVLLEMLHQCSQGKGALLLVFPEGFYTEKCTALLTALQTNTAPSPVAAGSDGATVLHRQSWDGQNHGDAGLVQSGNREYIVVVMLHSTGELNWADTSPIVSDIARLTYGFFNGTLPPAVPPITQAPPL
jgi:hypothetical protein